MSMVGFPLLLIPLAIFNIIVFLMPGLSFTEPLFRLTLMSGAEWGVTLSDILLAVGVMLLLLEVIKGSRPGSKFLTDHLLSLLVFGGSAAEFVLLPQFASSTYFLLVLLSMVEFLSGIALQTRRSVQFAPAGSSRAAGRTVQAPAEPRFEPQPASAPPPTAAAEAPQPREDQTTPAGAEPLPSAASVAESVLLEHPIPRPAQPAGAPREASPQVTSPELQPSGAAPASSENPDR